MKKIVLAFCACILFSIIGLVLFNNNKPQNAVYAQNTQSYLRLHIRANSNSEADQAVKLKVKEKVVNFLTPMIAECETLKDAHELLKNNLCAIKNVADSTLKAEGFGYTAQPRLCDEFFPTRAYKDVVLKEGVYDALIIDLGSGVGNNWWCVVYPPLCFIGAENSTENTIVYKSKLYEIVDKFFN